MFGDAGWSPTEEGGAPGNSTLSKTNSSLEHVGAPVSQGSMRSRPDNSLLREGSGGITVVAHDIQALHVSPWIEP